MPQYTATITPFRIAEGEQTAESCRAKDACGYYVCTPGGPAYYYRTKAAAVEAKRMLDVGGMPAYGRPWWPRATVYIA